MAAFDYDRAAKTAKRLLAKFGRNQTMEIAREVKGGGPAHNPGPSTWPRSPCTGVVLPATSNKLQVFDDMARAGTLEAEKHRYVILAAIGLEYEPANNMRLYFRGETWSIIGCTPLDPAGTPVLYKMGAKKI